MQATSSQKVTTRRLSWLHISDLHFKSTDPYDRDVVLNALLNSMTRFKARGLVPDVIFFTGDVAHGGAKPEYERATAFFDSLLAKLGLRKDALFVIPGNHDVDRSQTIGLIRTLQSQSEATSYFGQNTPLLHISGRQKAFAEWYDSFFAGIRRFETHTTCGPYEVHQSSGFRLGILPINTAAFFLADDDYGKLWVGRRCLDEVITKLQEPADLTVALMHHPLDWLHEVERTQVSTSLFKSVDCILRGHLHQTELAQVSGTSGSILHLAAGASYQGSEWPNKATFVEVYDDHLRLVPIKFEDLPSPSGR